jgi:hypothetical protein
MTLTAALQAIERVLLTLWVGGLWITGLVHAPVLFASFNRVLAGEVAGRLFSGTSLVGLLCAVLLLVLAAVRLRGALLRDWRTHVLVVMLLLIVAGEFGVAARMRELKDVMFHHPDTLRLHAEFGRLHAVASGLYALEALLGLVLVVAGPRPRAAQAGS